MYTGGKRMVFKKSLGKKRSRYSGYNNNNKTTATYPLYKSNFTRLTKTNLTQLKATVQTKVVLDNSSVYTSPAGVQYFNLATLLSGSPEFVSRVSQYSYYMISGMGVTFTRRWIDPIALGVSGTSAGFLNLSQGLSMLSCNFYPTLLSATVGQPVEDADSSWKVSPFIHGAQSHYQPFPKNFTQGVNSNGLGVWNACTQYANIYGELALYNDGGVTSSDVGTMSIWDVEFNIYVSFCNNTGN